MGEIWGSFGKKIGNTVRVNRFETYLNPYLVNYFRTVCGNRVRVELSTGKVRPKPWMRGGRGPPGRIRRPYDPNDRCYECGERGHYAYDCSRSRRGGRGGRSR